MQRREERLGQGEGRRADGVARLEQGGDAGVVFEDGSQPPRERGELSGPREGGVGLAVHLAEDGVEDEVIQLLLAADVAVQRAGNHAEAGGQGAHAQGRRAMGADDREGLGDDALAGEHAAAVLLAAGGLNHSGPSPRALACRLPLAVHACPLWSGLTVNIVHGNVNSVARN